MARIYDLVMTHKLDADDFFIHRIQQHAAESRLNFFLVEPAWVETFYQRFERGEVWARVLLNMHSEHHQPEEIYHRLVRLAAQRNTQVIDPPEVALNAFDKARLHAVLVEAGVPVPPTLIVPREDLAAFQLQERDLAALGVPFVIKPAMGYGRRGVVLDATSVADLSRSIAAWVDAKYLLQRRIMPRDLGGEPAYFRVYFVFGTIWCCWWNCYTDRYRVTTPEDMQQFELDPLIQVVRHIAALTRMRFFSSEIAQTESGTFVVIDYVNDQCHMLSQTAAPQIGVPDVVVAGIAQRLVEAAKELLGRS